MKKLRGFAIAAAIIAAVCAGATRARAQSGCAQIAGQVCFWVQLSTLSPAQPPVAHQGIAYGQTFTAANATNWSIVSGGGAPTQLGLTANVGSSFSITGTPTAPGGAIWTIGWTANGGNYQTTVTVQVAGVTGVTVLPGAPSVNETQVQDFTAAAVFSDQTSADITHSLASWALTTGAGCAGSSIGASGATGGAFTAGSTPGACGIQATFGGASGTATATVVSTSGAITIQTTSLCNAQQFQAYTIDKMPTGCATFLTASGGVPPYSWSITSGSLPTGLTLSSGATSPWSGLISGSATTAGAGTSITFKVTDSNTPSANTQMVTLASGIAVEAISTVTANVQSPLTANTAGSLSATGTYADGSTAPISTSNGTQAYATANGAANSNASTIQVSSGTQTETGDLAVVAAVSWSQTTACSSITTTVTSPNENFTAATTPIGQTGAAPPYYNCAQLFYATNITGAAADQPTCNFSIAAGAICLVKYYHGMPTSAVLDQHPTPTEALNATACTPNAVTTGQANELIELLCVPTGATLITPPSGFTGNAAGGAAGGAGPLTVLSDTLVSAIQTSYAPQATFTPAPQNEVTAFATFFANATLDGTVTWTSSNAACATIGLVQQNYYEVIAQPVTTGCTATITPAFVGASPTIVAATVSVAPSTTDTAIIVKPQADSLPIGGTVTYTAVGNVTGNTYTATWGSSNSSLVSIGPTNGVAKCLASTGTTPATITATVAGFTSEQAASLSCGSSTVTAASCSEPNVANAFAQLTSYSGAVTLAIPAGTCSWTSNLKVWLGNASGQTGYTFLPNVTSLTVQAATGVTCTGTPGSSNYGCTASDNTTIEDGIDANSPSPLTIDSGAAAGASVRVTGITFEPASSSIPSKNQAILDLVAAVSGTTLRLDHDHFICQNGQSCFEVDGPLTGVADHNVLDLGSATTYSNGMRVYNDLLDTVGNGDGGFMAPTDWGSANFFFAEDNQINGGYASDCADAGRMVARYNMFANPQDAMMSHPTKDYAGPERGCRAQEFYHNYISGDSTFAVLGGQGGTWLIWGNTVNSANNTASWFWAGDNYRSCASCNGAPAGYFPPNGWGQCGTDMNYPGNPGTDSPWDGNSNTTTGYPCLDNLGRGQQADAMNGQSFPSRVDTATGTQSWPHQYLEPIYLFDNTLPSSLYTQEILNQDYTTAKNRDIYGDNTSCAGSGCSSLSTGTGYGTLAQRPTSCTAGAGGTYATSPTGSYGVAYWATDANGGQGELYVCTAANTWTGIYSPYTYPHPLDTGP